MKSQFFEFRIGINNGPVIASLVGKKRFIYDIWGDAVNVAARLETHSEAGRINASDHVFHQMAPYFEFTGQGPIDLKTRHR